MNLLNELLVFGPMKLMSVHNVIIVHYIRSNLWQYNY